MSFNIGIDLGGTFIKYGIVNENGEIIEKGKAATPAECGYAETVAVIASVAGKMSAAHGVPICGLGIGAPGVVDGEKGIVRTSGNLGWENKPLAEDLSAELSIPAVLTNDANAAALGEARFGSGKGSRDVVFVTLGTGVGTGIITEGILLEGKVGAGAEGGHIALKMGGEMCSCGKRGCWEAYASATALIRQTRKAMELHPESLMNKEAEKEGKVSGRTAFNAAKRGDAAAKKVVDNYIKYVAEGVISMVNLFRPDYVLIGGGISNEGDWFMQKIQRRVNRYSFGGHRNPKVLVRKAVLGNDAGIYGAAALAMK